MPIGFVPVALIVRLNEAKIRMCNKSTLPGSRAVLLKNAPTNPDAGRWQKERSNTNIYKWEILQWKETYRGGMAMSQFFRYVSNATSECRFHFCAQ